MGVEDGRGCREGRGGRVGGGRREGFWWVPGMVLLGTATTVAVPSIFTGILQCERLVRNRILFS